MGFSFINHRYRTLVLFTALAAGLRAQTTTVPWSSYAHDPQHTALSTIGAQRLEQIKWSTPIDLLLAGSSGTLYIHYGSPLITAGNTVLVAVRTGANTFQMEAHSGSSGTVLYTLPTDFTPPPHNWYPPYSPALSQGTRLYYAGAGGTVYYRDQLDSTSGPSGQIAFYGNSLYAADQSAFAGAVMISTPITADANGNIYFGFDVTGPNPANLTSGLARIAPDGSGSWISASAAAQGDTNIVEVAENCAPALSNDGSMVYFSVSQGPVGTGSSGGYLVALNSTTLAPLARIRLTDPETGTDAQIPDVSSASPTVGPDGDVYYGVLEHVCCSNNDRGWLLHFDKNLTTVKIPGAFGWDTTASEVPAKLVPSYSGTSAYLLFTKYNNYLGVGTGNGMNKIAVLDPNTPMTDPVTGTTVMQEVITILGPTLDPPGNTNGTVREWCINSGAIDPFSAAAIANSEDGTVYRWDFASNSFLQSVVLTSGVGEAYTPTAIGADGTAYAINDGYLFAVGQASNLTITSSRTGNFSQGQSGATYTLTATNSGAAETNGIVTLTESLPTGLTATAIGGVGWSCTQPAGPCARSDSLMPGISYPAITLSVNVAPNAPSSVTNTVNISSDGAANSVNSTAHDTTVINLMPQLSIVSTHSGNFSQGQTGAIYSVIVSNSASGGPTNGAVTATDMAPSGLTLVSMSGSGWNCAALPSCTTSVLLVPGASYPPITVIVNVGGSAPLSVTNQVSVSGGDSSTATGSDPTNITPGPLTITTYNVPWVTQYQSYSTILTATGGVYPYTWSVLTSTGVSLPEGMSLNPSSGVISATQVNGQGGYEFTVQITDSASPIPNTATQVLDIGVNSDTSFAGCQMFPPDSIYNQRIDGLPVDVNPEHQIPAGFLSASIHPDFGHGFYPGPGGIPWMRVPANQPLTTENLAYDGQIQPAGTYQWPLPPWPYAVVEGTAFGQNGPDHHILILQTSTNNINGPQNGACMLYETYQNSSVPGAFNAATNTWSFNNGIAYNLNSDEIASSIDMLDNGAQDSAGVPIVPLLLRYSEVPLGAQHPLRVTFPSPTNWFIWPGTGCCAGSGPPQGLLYRLKASVNWQAVCPVSINPQAATFLQALQQYGAYMSDHGAAGYVQGVPDVRWNDDDLACVKNFTVNDLEVVDNSALEVSSISGQTRPYVLQATLPVFAVGTPYSTAIAEVGGNSATLQWALSSGSLPPGLSLNPNTATIAGTPTSSAGSPYNFGIVATDTTSALPSAEQQFTLAITASLAPDLTLALSHSGDFMQGESGAAYNINVSNIGAAPTTGTVTVVDTLQPGVTATAISGTGWTCTLATVSCTRSDALAAGGSYPVTVIVTIGYTVPFLSTNVATVSGGGEVITSNDQSSDLTISYQFPGWIVTSTHTGNFMPGQTGAIYMLTLTNVGGTSSSGTVTLVDTLPAGLTATAMGGTGWACTLATLTCTRSDALLPAGGYPAITLTVNVTNSPAVVTNQVSVSGGGARPAGGSDPTNIGLTPLLSITKFHTGNFTLGQTGAAYSVVVSNSAASIPTTAPVTVTETIPAGLTLVSMAGGGWDCSGVTSCARSDPLNGGFSYSTITVTVNVSQSAASQVTNQVTVTGGGSVSANAQDVTSISLESQAITFGPLLNQPYGTAPFTVSAMASSNLPVSFGTTSAACSVTGATVTLLGVGPCTIQATQPGNTLYAAAPPVIQTFQVTAATAILSSLSLSFPNTLVGKSSPTQTVSLQNTGNTALIITSILPAGADAANYQYTADSVHPCPISPATLAAGAGCTLDVAFAPIAQGAHGNAQLAIADNSGNQTGVTQTIALSGTGIVLSSIAVTANSGSIPYNGSEQFTASGTYSDTSTSDLTRLAAWSSTVPAVASIGAVGLATGSAVGQTNIAATLSGVTSNAFPLTVVAGAPATISIVSGSAQGAAVGTAFAALLQALVKDAAGNAAPNAAVTFTAPSTGAGGTFANGQPTYTTATNSAGLATSSAFTANATPGGYLVTASVTGVSTPASFPLTNLTPAVLSIVKAHTGAFAQRQSGAAYTVTVANAAGAGPTVGMVAVTETVPSGLTLVSMNGGATWNCSVLPFCTTNTVLSPGSSYPIAVTVNVAANAAPSLTNQVTVSGGGSVTASFSDPATITYISPCDLNGDGATNVADVQLIVNEALGISPLVNDLDNDGVVTVADVQIVINAALGLGCSAS